MTILQKLHSRGAVIFISCFVLALTSVGLPSTSHSIRVAEPVGRTTNDLLVQLSKATTSDQRASISESLAKLGPKAIPDLETHLKRKRESSEASRRKVLSATGAAVPDKSGRFKIPKRSTASKQKKNDDFDWLDAIAKLSPRAGLSDVVVDVAVIRALAAMKDPAAGKIIVDFAFAESGVAYRDECGRYLRKMSPYSLPALIHGSQSRKNSSMKRYTRYQLERLDRQNAHKALLAAPNEDLKISILRAFADSQYREAVFAVLDHVDHVAPRVRAAARTAWQEFATGKEPPKPPERKLALPNGEQTKNKEPLWLDHRVLATTAIRVRLKEVTGSSPNKNASLAILTDTLFGHYDSQRKKALQLDFEAAKAMANANKTSQAAAVYDRILAQNPEFAERSEMVSAYISVAEGFESEKKWQEASVAYGKASAVATDNQRANEALKKHHLARAKAAGNSGQEAEAARELAAEINTSPSGSPASSAKKANKLFLFAGLAAVAFAIIFLILGISRRKQSRA